MYDIRQFRPALYALLILGFSGFALAAQSPGLWVLAVGGVLLNAWLIRRKHFTPLPRLVANGLTLLALLYIGLVVRTMAAILVIGQFLVLLQLVKLYEQRANRDYAQLIVLSLLLMVAAAINTASLAFGLMFIVYLFLSLYCCLLFHLKVETDHARVAITVPDLPLDPASLRHDQRFLARSMRRLTLFVSFTAIAMAVVVFLFFPRGTGANLFAPLQSKPPQALSGFSDNVSFENIARITQNNEVVARVRVWHNDQPVNGTETLWLRGTTLNVYHGGQTNSDGSHSAPTWTWERSVPEAPFDDNAENLDPIGRKGYPPDLWKQEIWLNPTGTNVLFAMAGPIAIQTDRDLPHVHYYATDEVFQAADPLTQPTHYVVLSRNDLDTKQAPRTPLPPDPRMAGMGDGYADTRPRQTDPAVKKSFLSFAQRPEVSGSDAQGPLAARRDPTQLTTPLDAQIAQNICDYLRENYRYTLNLTDAVNLNDGKDPLLGFLNDFKKGHCEFFAGAMTMLCQSLGMDARLVVGFKCDEYNNTPSADYYIVRQSHAHAWVEVLTPTGWQTFDPTSSREADTMVQASWWNDVKHLMDYLEYTWANNVVAYDRDDQGNLLKDAEAKLTNVGIRGTNSADSLRGVMKETWRSWFTEANFFIVSSRIIAWAIYVLIFAMVGAVGGFFWGQWKLRQRARRIGLDNLPASDQLRLARQLGFYDDLMQLLERHQITRPRHLTPLEFSNQITFLPAEVYDAIRRLTSIFYRIRYGRHEISYEQRQRLNRVIARIGETLSSDL